MKNLRKTRDASRLDQAEPPESTTQDETQDETLSQQWAALDLGSNSFHLLMVRPCGASFVVLERLKEKVQLLGGFSDGRIQPDAAQRGLDCLARFAQRLRPIPPERILIMGTCALREADNASAFLGDAAALLPAPVQIISGAREAELVYTAVDHHLDSPDTSKLVVDIGGGSTEFAWGAGPASAGAQSITLGCVSLSNQFFTPGADTAAAYRLARAHAVSCLQGADGLPEQTFRRVYGTSGTIESIQTVLSANGWSGDLITAEAIALLEQELVVGRWVSGVGMPGLAPDRIDIFPAGVAVLAACFDVLDIQAMSYVDVSLLHGMMCEAVVAPRQTRLNEESLQENSVRQLADRFAVDAAQAGRVEHTAMALFRQAEIDWPQIGEYEALFRWASQLHELGTQISARHYHRHGAYIIKHAQLPGFRDLEKNVLALLIRGHRRSLPGLAFQAFPADVAEALQRLVVLLRLAVILERSHNDADSPVVVFKVSGSALHLTLPENWLADHPLSAREFEVEAKQLEGGGFALHLN